MPVAVKCDKPVFIDPHGMKTLSGAVFFILCVCSAHSLIIGGAYLAESVFFYSGVVLVYLILYWGSRRGIGSMPATLIFFMALILKSFYILFFPPSDDLYRYIWEGRIQLYGYNPYIVAPDAPELHPLRDNLWNHINQKIYTAIYWPLAQMFFSLTSWISPSVLFFKSLFTAFDLAGGWFLWRLLIHFQISPKWLLFYLWNPFTLIYISGEGHLDIIITFLLLAGLLFYIRRNYSIAVSVFVASFLIKFSSIFLLPFVLREIPRRYFWPLLLVPFFFLYYYAEGIDFLKVPIQFANTFAHNGPFYIFFRKLLGFPAADVVFILKILLACGLLYVFFFQNHFMAALKKALIWIFLCSPTVHPWYLLLLVPFTILFRQKSLFVLTACSIVFYFYFNSKVSLGFLHQQLFLAACVWLPFFLTLLWEKIKNRQTFPKTFDMVKSVSVIIPTLNEEKNIEKCLTSLVDQPGLGEVILVDGGSKDTTLMLAENFRSKLPQLRILHSGRGRGIQIATAWQQALGDIVLILHADTEIRNSLLTRLVSVLNENPDASGGACEGRYREIGAGLGFIEFLNRFRAKTLGIAFGDQGQFFRRQALKYFPKLWLLEDIELSIVLQQQGRLLFVKDGLAISSRRWQQRTFWGNLINVIFIVGSYLLLRNFIAPEKLSRYYYRHYYGNKPGEQFS